MKHVPSGNSSGNSRGQGSPFPDAFRLFPKGKAETERSPRNSGRKAESGKRKTEIQKTEGMRK